MKTEQLLRLIEVANYNLYVSALSCVTPKQASLYREMRRPMVGDLVMESTTIYHKNRNPIECVGTLISTGMAPYFATREEATAAGRYEDESIPERLVWDIRLDFDGGRMFRWENADFIKIKQELAGL